MLTKKFAIQNLYEDSKKFIKKLQNNYSVAFRVLYNQQKKLRDESQRKELIEKINSKYTHSVKAAEYLVMEVETFIKREVANKERISKGILKLEKRLIGENNLKKRGKLSSKIARLQKSIGSKVVLNHVSTNI